MSDTGVNGSVTSVDNQIRSLKQNATALQPQAMHGVLEAYLESPQSREQMVAGHGTADAEEAIRHHRREMAEYILKMEKMLPR
ncbi:uncharacterized protein BP5553_04360 [Venustampulla echinocandica]|uniref:Uncharacterized protein n=1 Tax=Venustampulla echinocandica TaxID=2656787 RepID=A0A370TWW9_9HELO|nr:uncharacterized protein BP5553_04360 [Venustampulla echinocandica]RDL40020.1 hypothetical protein BP5553_04360 [Venustampulla echinocandica]